MAVTNTPTTDTPTTGTELTCLVPFVTPFLAPLREWQARGIETYRALRDAGRVSILAAACPGAGKMVFGCLVVREEFERGADCVIVLVPTEALKQQWAKSAAEWGITLTANWPGTAITLPADVHGAILSYGQIASLPDGLRLFCARKSAVVILDELHHCGQTLKWGEAVSHGAEFAQARLCLTGTAWRTDGLPIPFLACDDSGAARVDIHYPYRRALADGVVRPAFFFVFGGRFEWTSPQGLQSASFDDLLGETGQSCRLRTALDPNGGWLRSVLTRAVADLQTMRETHPRAKGLINCVDAVHARKVAQLTEELSGNKPALALFDDPKAAAVLARFRSDDTGFLVACRMGTEGYDAPDLRLLVWASNITSELYFWQTVGRLLRTVPNLFYQDAVVFIPADPRLVEMAGRFSSEPSVSLRKEQSLTKENVPATGPDAPRLRPAAVHSEAMEPRIVTAGEIISEERMLEARQLKASRPYLFHLPDYYVAAELTQVEAGRKEYEDLRWGEEQEAGCNAGSGDKHDTGSLSQNLDIVAARDRTRTLPIGVPEVYDERKAALRRECSQLAQQIAQELGMTSGRVHQIFNRHLGFRQTDATIAQLQEKVDLLRLRVLDLKHPVEIRREHSPLGTDDSQSYT